MWQKFLNGEIYVDLNSKEEINDFLNKCADRGLCWASGDKANKGVMKKYFQDRMLVTYDICDFSCNKKALMHVALEPKNNKQIIKWSDFMNNIFTKEDLKTGDLIKRRNGNVEIVNRELEMLIRQKEWNDLDSFREDLTHKYFSDEDIVAVRRPMRKSDCQFSAFKEERGILIYERKEVEEMTLAEVCKLLGKEIKIVK